MSRGIAVAVCVCICLAMFAGPLVFEVRAQVPDAEESGSGANPEDASSTGQAREHFAVGIEHYDARRFREAIREFEQAANLVPSAEIWFNIARAHEQLSEFDRAVDNYRRYLSDQVDPPDRETVEAHIESLSARAEAARLAQQRAPTTGSLRIETTETGAQVTLDGQEVGETPIIAPLTLGGGSHDLLIEHEGFIPGRAQVRVEPGVASAAYLALEPRTEYRAVRGSRIVTWIAGGLAVVAFGGSIYMGALAAGSRNDDPETALDQALLSDVLLGAGIGLSVTALFFYFFEGRAVDTELVGASPSERTSAM